MKKHHRNLVRIIGGRWRSRQISFVDREDLRPTSDRLRETLFNWLQPRIHGARCLDAFAGSGVLGFEALSRGASHVTFVDNNRDIIEHMREQASVLEAEEAETIQSQMPLPPGRLTQPFEIVFLDPPFEQPELITESAQCLHTQHLLTPDAFVYIERHRRAPVPTLPETWTLHRETTAGQVTGALYTVN
ncbi:MAG: ribosomal RNA small subunit methyltransferase D [marine bacterium B5-7]|nr:MAG: ribosomal RNA small subunit methyltransferase D [marine bacterium B5-7]